MDDTPPNSASSAESDSTFSVARRLLLYCGRGEGSGILLGLSLLLPGTLISLLQPWPMKLVLDSVIGTAPPPAFLSKFAQLFAAASPRIGLLLVLCIAQLLLALLAGLLTVASTCVLVAVGLRMVFK